MTSSHRPATATLAHTASANGRACGGGINSATNAPKSAPRNTRDHSAAKMQAASRKTPSPPRRQGHVIGQPFIGRRRSLLNRGITRNDVRSRLPGLLADRRPHLFPAVFVGGLGGEDMRAGNQPRHVDAGMPEILADQHVGQFDRQQQGQHQVREETRAGADGDANTCCSAM